VAAPTVATHPCRFETLNDIQSPAVAGQLAVPLIASRAEALERARALLPRIRARAERAEQERRIPDETIRELLDAGLFNIATPRAHGGADLGFATLVDVTTLLASACGSTGWVFGVLTGHAWMTGLFPPETQAEVFADPRVLIGSVFRLAGKTEPVPGGYRITGAEGRFCSGIDFSSWVVVGNAVQRVAAPAEPRFLLVSMDDVDIVDDWFTAGMRGTGSRTIRIADAFVPEHRTVLTADLMKGLSPGARHHASAPHFSVPFPVGQPFSLIGAPLGMARGALDVLAESLTGKLASMLPEQAGEQGALFARYARAAADIDAAYALVLRDAELLDSLRDPAALATVEKARVQRNLAYAAQACRYAVTSLFEASGGSGVYDSSVLQRAWRDVGCATAHAAFNWDGAASGFGRARLGVAASRFTGMRR
jgi:alkylation response protein AidB-like acyl-CoA dehydrogenase